MSTARQLAVGDRAPDFELKNAKGQSFRLSDYLGKKSVVVFFYPADNSPGCTQQVCAFQRKFPDFRAANAEVFGVSNGGVADKEKFIASNRVTSYELLIDEGDKVRKAWKVPRALFGVIPGRVTYVVDPAGKVVEIFDDLARAALHTDKALDAVRAAAKTKQ
eukprot:gene3264-2407_t